MGGIILINQKSSAPNSNQDNLPREIYETAGKAPFTCTLIPNENYSLVSNSLTISFNGNEDAFNLEEVEIINALKPVNQNVFMKFHLYPDNTVFPFSTHL